MAERHFAPDTFELRKEWGNFAWDAPRINTCCAIDMVFAECDR